MFSVGESDAGDCVTFPASCGFRVNSAQYFTRVQRPGLARRAPHFLILQPCTRVGAGSSNPTRRTLSHFVRADSRPGKHFESSSDRAQPRNRRQIDVVLIVPRSFTLVTFSPEARYTLYIGLINKPMLLHTVEGQASEKSASLKWRTGTGGRGSSWLAVVHRSKQIKKESWKNNECRLSGKQL